MSSQEKVIETKICKFCSASFDITDKDMEFYDKISPIFPKSPPIPLIKGEARNEQGDSVKYPIPTPTLCPDCRQQRRLSFRNERKLYKRKCNLTGKDIISIYSPDKPYKIYEQKAWLSDKWNPMDYGSEVGIDFGRSFFEQFGEFVKEVPKPHNLSEGNENSEYSYSGYCKNCYFLFIGGLCEDCYFSEYLTKCNNCMDCFDLENSEYCYECVESYNIRKSIKLQKSKNCNDCHFSFNLENCNNCIFCNNLKNRSYHIFNKPYSKEDYEKKLEELKISNYKNYASHTAEMDSISSKSTVKNLNLINCENCIGDNMKNSKNIFNVFWGTNSNNCKYSEMNNYCNDCYDSSSFQSELCLEVGSGGNTYKTGFCFDLFNGNKNIYYTILSTGCSDCFGCIGLRNSQYCIFNKQYTREQYEELVPKIIEHMKTTGEWGEFFPSSLSPFGYNETVASEYFPLSKEEALKRGFKWSDYEAPFPKVEKILPASKLPDDISAIPDDILNWAIECEVTGKPFRIIKQELEFYRKHDLPIPRRHPDQRHLDRMKLRNPRKLYDRKCDKCGVDMKTTYSPERKEIVYCERCYEKEVY